MKTSVKAIALACALLVGASPLSGLGSPDPQTAVQTNDYVVVLHGMGRTPVSMLRLAHTLDNAGYTVVNKWYWSLGRGSDDLLKRLDEIVRQECVDPSRRIHFVTHSLGGILTRLYLANRSDLNVGRVVMLAPPSKGSELADTFKKYPIYEKVMGGTGTGLGTSTGDLARALQPVDFELGVIAGNKTINPLYSYLIPGPDDGKVSVERTKTQGMTDFIVLPATHTWMMQRDDVAHQVLHFLRYGQFDRKRSVH